MKLSYIGQSSNDVIGGLSYLADMSSSSLGLSGAKNRFCRDTEEGVKKI